MPRPLHSVEACIFSLLSVLAISLNPVLASPAQSPPAMSGCQSAAAETAVVERITTHGELVLADGRLLRLRGLVLSGERQATAFLDATVKGRRVDIGGLPRTPDRWQRYATSHVVLHLPNGGRQLVSEALISQGQAVVRPAELPTACADWLLAVEREARRARKGIWERDFPLDSGNLTALSRDDGQYVIVSGTIITVGERQYATYLNFGTRRNHDFAVYIAGRQWQAILKTGLTAMELTGKRVMVRGDIIAGQLAGQAPVMETTHAAEISFEMD